MILRLTISFTREEREALDRLARTDVRPAKDEVRALVRAEAERRGLWRPAENDGLTAQPGGRA